MPRLPPPIPLHDPLVDKTGRVTSTWVYYFTDQGQSVTSSSQSVGSVPLTAQSATIGATALPIQSVNAGYYRITTYARITQAAGTSSSLTVAIGWTESGVSLSTSGAALTGNTVTTGQSFTTTLLRDASSPITYTASYTSTGVPAMQYRLTVIVEALDV